RILHTCSYFDQIAPRRKGEEPAGWAMHTAMRRRCNVRYFWLPLGDGSLLDHHPQLLTVIGTTHRLFKADQSAGIEREKRLIHCLHTVSALTYLHLRIDLMDFVLTDEVADSCVRNEDFLR